MYRKILNIAIVWIIIFVWGFIRGWHMTPPGYIAITAAVIITGYTIYTAFKERA